MAWLLKSIEAYAAALEAIGSEPPPAPRWTQDWFPRLDAAAAYAMVRDTKPRRIVEVGSGHSTRFMARAVADGKLATQITCIDPEPRATIRGLKVDWISSPVQNVGAFPALQSNDILFIDSSHQVKPGNDLDFLLEKVIPELPRGVRVHFHDIFLPDDYPADWAWRRYDEQAAVARLLKNGEFLQDFSSHQADKKFSGILARLPLVPGARESSLWLTRR
jgi:hypothetical protein